VASSGASGIELRFNIILWNARDAAAALVRQGDECQVPIILSAVSLESFFNELQHQLEAPLIGACGDPTLETLAGVLGELEDNRGSMRSKVRLAYFVLTQSSLPKGEQKFQDLELLIRLRDALVHAKPATFDMQEPHLGSNFKLVRALSSRHLIPSGSEHEPHVWTHHALTPSVARWSFNTALSNIGELLNILSPDQPTRQTFESVLASMTPLEVELAA
jgi:hypothetical protein